jgi:hypothetical protein
MRRDVRGEAVEQIPGQEERKLNFDHGAARVAYAYRDRVARTILRVPRGHFYGLTDPVHVLLRFEVGRPCV